MSRVVLSSLLNGAGADVDRTIKLREPNCGQSSRSVVSALSIITSFLVHSRTCYLTSSTLAVIHCTVVPTIVLSTNVVSTIVVSVIVVSTIAVSTTALSTVIL